MSLLVFSSTAFLTEQLQLPAAAIIRLSQTYIHTQHITGDLNESKKHAIAESNQLSQAGPNKKCYLDADVIYQYPRKAVLAESLGGSKRWTGG